MTDARRDFAAASYLLPFWPELGFQEGKTWLAMGEPDLAFAAWAETLRRSSEKAPDLYSQMFGLIKSDVALLDRWRIGPGRQAIPSHFLQNAGPLEFSLELERLLSEDRPSPDSGRSSELSSFSPTQLQTLFGIWYQKGDKAELAQTLEQRPEWKKIGWRELSRAYADREDFRRAYETALQFATPPEIPKAESQESLETLKARFLLNRTDVGTGVALYFAQLKENQTDGALATVRELETLPGSPQYLSFLEARLWAQQQKWKEAWQAMAQYILGKAPG